MNNTRKIIARGGIILVSSFCLLSLTGCFDVDNQFKQLRGIVLDGTHADYTVEAEFGLGGFVIGVVQKIVGFAADDDEDARIVQSVLKEIKGIQIGTYKLNNYSFERTDVFSKMQGIISYMNGFDYDSIIRNYDVDGASLIMVRTSRDRPDRIREIVILDFGHNEMNLVQLKGDIANIIDVVIREKEIPGMDEALEKSN